MLRGHVDAITTTGYIEGWALDTAAQLIPLQISVRSSNGEVLAQGLAYLFRDDLVMSELAGGWCAFSLHCSIPPHEICNNAIELFSRSGELISSSDSLRLREESKRSAHSNINQVLRDDPTFISNIQMLAGCEELIAGYASLMGLENFIRAAYIYVLGRSVNQDSLCFYSKLLGSGGISPYALLCVLADTEEARAKGHPLIAPTFEGFPFKAEWW